jgi:branched-chain amino acid transport system ATP-binding protein
MLLSAEEVVSGYADVNILQGISLRAEEGRVTGVIGPNGAGKSTLLKTLYGFLKLRGGRVFLDGTDVSHVPPHMKPQLGVSFIPQERSIFPYLTVEENLMLGGWIKRGDKAQVRRSVEDILERFTILKNKLNKKAGDLSGGEQKMLEVARSLVVRPKLLLVDEPSFGLAPKVVVDIYKKIKELNEEEGITVLLVDQNVRHVMEFSHYLYVLEMGKVAAEGPKSDFEGKLYDIVKDWLRF